MNVKEFLKPTKEKIILSVATILVLFFSAPYIINENILAIIYIPIIASGFLLATCAGDVCSGSVELSTITTIIYAYFISCLIVWIYNKVKKK